MLLVTGTAAAGAPQAAAPPAERAQPPSDSPVPSIPGMSPGAARKAEEFPAKVELAGLWKDDAGRLLVGVRFVMKPKWHAYWRNPGDGGLPPRFEATLPSGWKQGEAIYPRPEVFRTEHETSFGYGDRAVIVLPFEFAAAPRSSGAAAPAGTTSAAGAAPATLSVKYMVCKEICLLGEAELPLGLPSAEDLSALPALPAVIDGRSYPKPLASIGGRASVEGDRLEIRGTCPKGVEGPPRVSFLSFDLPGFGVHGGAVTAGEVADGHVRVTLELEPDTSLPESQVPAVGGLVMFGTKLSDPCVEFSLQVPKDPGR